MKFFHIADTHLGAIPDAGFAWSEERRSEIWESFRSVVAKADREEVDLLLIAGDLFHRQPLMRELKEVNYLFSTLKKTKVVFIIGNHDYLKVDSYYLDFPWSENVTCLRGKECESVVFEDLDTEVYGLSYHTREIKEPKYNDLQPEKKAGFSILPGLPNHHQFLYCHFCCLHFLLFCPLSDLLCFLWTVSEFLQPD